MIPIKIEQPHGYLLDGDGAVILRFANWETGEHSVSESVESVEYVNGPSAHEREVHESYRDEQS